MNSALATATVLMLCTPPVIVAVVVGFYGFMLALRVRGAA